MEATVLGPAIRQDIESKLPQDDVSRVQGNKDGFTYCGERKFRITSTGQENYLSYNEQLTTLTLLSTQDSEIGESIPIKLEVYLVNYPTIKKEVTFLVTIKACVVLTLTPSTTPDTTYVMEVPAFKKSVEVNAFTQEPKCSSSITYNIQMFNKNTNASENLPTWIK